MLNNASNVQTKKTTLDVGGTNFINSEVGNSGENPGMIQEPTLTKLNSLALGSDPNLIRPGVKISGLNLEKMAESLMIGHESPQIA